jgi:hypothetical protein
MLKFENAQSPVCVFFLLYEVKWKASKQQVKIKQKIASNPLTKIKTPSIGAVKSSSQLWTPFTMSRCLFIQ